MYLFPDWIIMIFDMCYVIVICDVMNKCDYVTSMKKLELCSQKKMTYPHETCSIVMLALIVK